MVNYDICFWWNSNHPKVVLRFGLPAFWAWRFFYLFVCTPLSWMRSIVCSASWFLYLWFDRLEISGRSWPVEKACDSMSRYLGGGNSNNHSTNTVRSTRPVATQTFLEFSPRKLGKIPILTNIFEMGWNHQPDKKTLLKDNGGSCPLMHILTGDSFWATPTSSPRVASHGPSPDMKKTHVPKFDACHTHRIHGTNVIFT